MANFHQTWWARSLGSCTWSWSLWWDNLTNDKKLTVSNGKKSLVRTKAEGCAQGLCARFVQSLVRCRRARCAPLCARVVRTLCARLVQSLVRCRRHKAFALFRTPVFERHKALGLVRIFISLVFVSVGYSSVFCISKRFQQCVKFLNSLLKLLKSFQVV